MAFSDYTLNSDDMDAIAQYMNTTGTVNPAAGTLQNNFKMWYNNLSFYEKYMDSTIQEASNRRNAFNVANVRSRAELSAVKQTLSTGFSREEARGQARVVDSAGNYPKQKGVTVLSAAKGTVPKGARPLIRRGTRGEAVKAWQSILGVATDGKFGKDTEAATIAWQTAHGLKADGVVGSGTWSTAMGASQAPNMPIEVAATTQVAPTDTPISAIPAGTVNPIQTVTKTATVAVATPVKQVAIEASHAPVETVTTPVSVKIAEASMIPIPQFVKNHPVASAGVAAGATGLGWLIKKLL